MEVCKSYSSQCYDKTSLLVVNGSLRSLNLGAERLLNDWKSKLLSGLSKGFCPFFSQMILSLFHIWRLRPHRCSPMHPNNKHAQDSSTYVVRVSTGVCYWPIQHPKVKMRLELRGRYSLSIWVRGRSKSIVFGYQRHYSSGSVEDKARGIKMPFLWSWMLNLDPGLE